MPPDSWGGQLIRKTLANLLGQARIENLEDRKVSLGPHAISQCQLADHRQLPQFGTEWMELEALAALEEGRVPIAFRSMNRGQSEPIVHPLRVQCTGTLPVAPRSSAALHFRR